MMKSSRLNRRRFLQAGGAAAIWIPASARGYTTAELRSFFVDGRMQVDISKWELDTPALCVDLDLLETNLARMQAAVGAAGIASRPHAKTHKCPEIARMQLDAGAVGVCAAKVSEAEVMFRNGIDEILMTTTNVTPTKINRAMTLAEACPGFIQATDSMDNARLLSEAATARGLLADVVVDVDPGMGRTGAPPGQPALGLAQLVDQLPGLRFRGMLSYDGASQHVAGFAARKVRTLAAMAPAAETFAAMRQAGLRADIFSGGGTGTYNIDHETTGLTDVQVGSYVFMDAQYLAIGGERDDAVYSDFEPSLTILATVLNDQYAGRATSDAGAKACTINRPWPIVKGETDIAYTSGSDEFGTIRYGTNASRTYRTGDKLELIVSHCDPVVNLYDYIHAVRNDRVEAIWRVAGRGMST